MPGVERDNREGRAQRVTVVKKSNADTQGAVPSNVASSASARDSATPSDPMLGAILNAKYRVTGLLAEGGMGRVYHGQHLRLDRKVAVKCVLPRYSAEPSIVSRFWAEAQMCARLSHANVVKLLDFGQRPAELGGELYAVMEFVEGETLEKLFEAHHEFEFRRVTSIMEQLLVALDYAHDHGVVHRDIKPANIVLQPAPGGAERVVLIDFGIAQGQINSSMSYANMVVGTPEFMAPEQAHGLSPTPSADIYSAGIVLFQLLTGLLPFTGHSVMEIFRQHIEAERPDPRKANPGRQIPAELAKVCLRALSADPLDRYPSAYEFCEAIVRVRRSVLPGRSDSRKAVTQSAERNAAKGARLSLPPPAGYQPQPSPGAYRVSSRRPARVSTPAASTPTAQGPTLPPPARADEPDLLKLVRLEAEADAYIAAGDLEAALATLFGGLDTSRGVLRTGDKDLGQSAAKSFAGKLSSVYGLLGQHDRAAAVAKFKSNPAAARTPVPRPSGPDSGGSSSVSAPDTNVPGTHRRTEPPSGD